MKQSYLVDSTMEVEYVAASKVAKEAIWLWKFLLGLEVVSLVISPIVLFCSNSGVMAQSKEPRNHKKGKHIERKYHMIREIVMREDVPIEMIASNENLADPFMKTLPTRVFNRHRDRLYVRCVPNML